MEIIKAHLSFLKIESYIAYGNLLGDQPAIKRFVFCTIMKINKLIISIEKLYHEVTIFEQFEFGIGIMLRSLLMDCLCTLKLNQYFYEQSEVIEYEELKEGFTKICTDFLHDGTIQMIDDIFLLQGGNKEKLKESAYKLASVFSMYYDFNSSDDKPRKSKLYNGKPNLKEIYKQATHQNHQTKTQLYNLYSYYSKYDHLSHWTGLTEHMSITDRIDKINVSIVLVMLNFRDTLQYAIIFDPTCSNLQASLDSWFQHMDEQYPYIDDKLR